MSEFAPPSKKAFAFSVESILSTTTDEKRPSVTEEAKEPERKRARVEGEHIYIYIQGARR